VPGSELSFERIRDLDPAQAIEALKYMYGMINEEKTNRNPVLRNELASHQELLDRSNNVARALHAYNIDIDGLVTVRLWSIQPPAPRVEELPTAEIESKVSEDQESVNVSIDGESSEMRGRTLSSTEMRGRSSSSGSQIQMARRTKQPDMATSQGRSPESWVWADPSGIGCQGGPPMGSSPASPEVGYPKGRVIAPRKST